MTKLIIRRWNTPISDSPVCVELICVVEEVKGGDVGGRSSINSFLLVHFSSQEEQMSALSQTLKKKNKNKKSFFFLYQPLILEGT